ncbi:ATP-binding protein [Brevibacillus dissolubilis]|uniref:ATP-binding protein n=1 Tax=Brevibacillus dissolubilis TaxID=1844116 RepID=UPI00159BBB90|nr:ATP-binding protein [Brevibacillus dissolubilis]
MIRVQIDCPAQHEYLELMEGTYQSTLEKVCFAGRHALYVAVHEALINAIEATQQTYGEETRETVSLQMTASPAEVVIHIIDSAGGIPQDVLDRQYCTTLEDRLWEENGRGLLIMKQMADELWFEKTDDGRQLVGLRKRGEHTSE